MTDANKKDDEKKGKAQGVVDSFVGPLLGAFGSAVHAFHAGVGDPFVTCAALLSLAIVLAAKSVEFPSPVENTLMPAQTRLAEPTWSFALLDYDREEQIVEVTFAPLPRAQKLIMRWSGKTSGLLVKDIHKIETGLAVVRFPMVGHWTPGETYEIQLIQEDFDGRRVIRSPVGDRLMIPSD